MRCFFLLITKVIKVNFSIIKYRFSIFVVLTLLVGCGDTNEGDIAPSLIQNPNSAQGYDETQSMPRLVFDCNEHDFGRLTPGESISYSFHFRNKGQSDLVISGCEASCGCTVADYPKNRIAPGEEGYVTVTFSSAGKSGQQLQEVTVFSDSQPARERLRIVAQVGH